MKNRQTSLTKSILLSIALTVIGFCSKAQDTRYSQVLANPLRLNPAILSANTDIKAALIYRSQWASVGKGYTSTAFSGVLPLFVSNGKGKVDFGLSIYKDKAGAFSKTDALFSMGYTVHLSAFSHVGFSLMGGFVQNNLNTGGQTFDSQYVLGSYSAGNPTFENALIQKSNYADVGFGALWFMNPPRMDAKLNAYVGVSGYHLNQPNQSFLGSAAARLPRKFSAQAGIKIMGEKGVDISPNFRVYSQNGNMESAVGSYFDVCLSDNLKIVGGLWYRKKDAYVMLLGIEHKTFTFSYSYDASVHPFNSYFPGLNTNEICFSYKLSRLTKYKIESFGSGNGTPSVKNNLFNNF